MVLNCSCVEILHFVEVTQEWPGLPRGVKFDPSDQEIIWHLLAKVGEGSSKPHPFIDAFITTLDVNGGICYTHPQHLPGVSQDGIASHFFHRTVKAYSTGSRKRRRICGGKEFSYVRWHKTGKTKPILLNGVQKGCKKIMVLYMFPENGGKEEDEKEGGHVISIVFYQQQQAKLGEKDDQDVRETAEATIANVALITPNFVTTEPPLITPNFVDQAQETHHIPQILENLPWLEEWLLNSEDDCEEMDNIDLPLNLLDSQQLPETFSWFEDFIQSQSPKRHRENDEQKNQPSLSAYAHLGPEQLKKDKEECQNLDHTGNVQLDSESSDIRLSQQEFSSQELYRLLGW
ncbi:NAC transcription factor-like protein [Medicago truncatula]|uniref:NAC transcription factor-like protein n=1 Tax=Medicago truncatula TaxID=3880 RepID=G7I497_MEDTR|nr:NAC transcription factor-like protein [Medicago truncatula]